MQKILVIGGAIMSLTFAGATLAARPGVQTASASPISQPKSGLNKTKICCKVPPKKIGVGVKH